MRIAVSVDVPDLDTALAFWEAALGLRETGRPGRGMAVIAKDDASLLLLERAAGSVPFRDAPARRDYAPHWTPVHLDFHVADAIAARDAAERAGAVLEAWYDLENRPQVAMMRDPFGHGFCLIGPRR